MNMQEMIARINFLAAKKRTEGLTESELLEQKELYEVILLRQYPRAGKAKTRQPACRRPGKHGAALMFTLGSGTVYYEDDFMLVINKPVGMLVHPTVKEDGSTLYNFVKRYYEAHNIESGLHPVSRLDRNTSGLVVFAKQPRIQFLLSQQQW